MDWVHRNLTGQVRGIIVVGSVSSQLRAAFRELNRQDIEIWEYNVSEDQQIELNKIL